MKPKFPISLIAPFSWSKDSPVMEDQVMLFVSLLQEFIDEWEGAKLLPDVEDDIGPMFDSLSYGRMRMAARACGFECNDFNPDSNLSFANSCPKEYLKDVAFPDLRKYVHTLMRAETWDGGHHSFIVEALNSGALLIVCHRLAHDARLRDAQD